MGVVALFTVYLIKQSSDHFTILGFIIISCILVGCDIFYIQEMIKKKIKAEKRADEAIAATEKTEKEESDDETNDR